MSDILTRLDELMRVEPVYDTPTIRDAQAEVERLRAIVDGETQTPAGEPDGKPAAEILRYIAKCGRCWVPGARILGNARACDIAAACTFGADAIDDSLAKIHDLRAEVERLRAIVDRLPKTADGVTIAPGMNLWDRWSVVSKISGFNTDADGDLSCLYFRGGGWDAISSDYYSTREAAEAAKEKE